MFDQQSRLQNLIALLEPYFFHKNKDVTLKTGKSFFISGGTTEIVNFPTGGIIMWSGAISAIPTGWVICDGTNGTPDLTDRFVIHADADSGGTNNVGDTGGASTVNLQHSHTSGTLATDTDSHSHDVTGSSASDSHSHAADGSLASGDDRHQHNSGSLSSDIPTATTVVQSGTGVTVASSTHTHIVNSGTTGLVGHDHVGSTASDSHSHGDGSYATDSDGHSHNVNSGSTANAGSTTQTIRDKYYALAFIQKT